MSITQGQLDRNDSPGTGSYNAHNHNPITSTDLKPDDTAFCIKDDDEEAFAKVVKELGYSIQFDDLCSDACGCSPRDAPQAEQLELFRSTLSKHGASLALVSLYEGNIEGCEIVKGK